MKKPDSDGIINTMKSRVFFILFIFLLFSSCKNSSHKSRIQLKESFFYLQADESSTVEEMQARTSDFKKLEHWGKHNLSNIVGIKGSYIWLKCEFTIPQELKNTNLALLIPYLHFSERVYVNGNYVGNTGRFPKEKGGELTVRYTPHFYLLPENILNQDGKNTVLIKVWSHGFGEISGDVFIGEEEDTEDEYRKQEFGHTGAYMMFAGAPCSIMLLFLMLYLCNKRKNKIDLTVASMAFFSMIFFSGFFAPVIPWYTSVGIPYIFFMKVALGVGVCFMMYYLSSFMILYIYNDYRKIEKIVKFVLTVICSIGILVAPNYYILMKMTPYIVAILTLEWASAFYYVFKAFKNPDRKTHARELIFSLSPLFITIIADLIIKYGFLNSNVVYLTIYGFCISFTMLMYFVTKKYSEINEHNIYLKDNLQREIEIQTVDITFANERLEQEIGRAEKDLEMASIVQKKFLPPLENKYFGWELAINYEPLSKVSGDLFDYYNDEDKLIGMSLFDASGHGVAASLVTMLSKNIIFRAFRDSCVNGGNVSSALMRINNQIISAKGSVDNYLTGELLRFGKIDENGKCEVELASAGHPYPVFYSTKENDIEEILTDPSEIQMGAIGIPDIEVSYPTIRFEMVKDDVLVVFTDGLLESANENHEQFGRNRINQIIKENYHLSANEIKLKLINSLNGFIGEELRDDDITFIVLKRI